MADAVISAKNSHSLEELIRLTGDEEKARCILEVVKDVKRYANYMRAQSLGINYGPHDLTFMDMLLFSWIKEQLDVRKT